MNRTVRHYALKFATILFYLIGAWMALSIYWTREIDVWVPAFLALGMIGAAIQRYQSY